MERCCGEDIPGVHNLGGGPGRKHGEMKRKEEGEQSPRVLARAGSWVEVGVAEGGAAAAFLVCPRWGGTLALSNNVPPSFASRDAE